MNTTESSGALRIRATTARGALPVPDAKVYISSVSPDGKSTVLASGITDNSGLSETFILPAPPKSNSEHPGERDPYAKYNVSVTADGYYPIESFDVPVFPGIMSTQPAELIPLLGGRLP